MFATLFFAVLDTRTGELEYGNCGHNAPYVLSAGGRQSLPTTGIPVGLIDGRSAKVGRLRLSPGDLLVTFTDGVTEAMDPRQEQFGNQRFEALLDAAAGARPADLLPTILGAVDDFAAGEEQADDITCLALRLMQAPSD